MVNEKLLSVSNILDHDNPAFMPGKVINNHKILPEMLQNILPYGSMFC